MRCSRKGRCDGRALPAEDAGTDLKNDWRRQMDELAAWIFIVLTIALGVFIGSFLSK